MSACTSVVAQSLFESPLRGDVQPPAPYGAECSDPRGSGEASHRRDGIWSTDKSDESCSQMCASGDGDVSSGLGDHGLGGLTASDPV